MYQGYTKSDVEELFVKDLNVKVSRGHSLNRDKFGPLGSARDMRKYRPTSSRTLW